MSEILTFPASRSQRVRRRPPPDDRRPPPPLSMPAAHAVRTIADMSMRATGGDAAIVDLVEALRRALGPDITVAEIAGARAVLGLILTCLPEVPS